MTTALQKIDLGRVVPSQEAMVSILGQTIAAWVAANSGLVAAEPDPDANKLVLSKNIQAALGTAVSALRVEMGHAISGVQASLQAAMTSESIIGVLAESGVDLSALAAALGVEDNGRLSEIQNQLNSAGGRLDGLDAELSLVQEFMEAYNSEVLKGDIISTILESDDDRKVSIYSYLELREFPEVNAATNTHVLQLLKDNQGANGGTDLNKNWCCITSSGCELTLVLPTDGVENGDGVYLEYRSTSKDHHAPVVAIMTEGQYAAQQAMAEWEAGGSQGDQPAEAVDEVVISEDYKPDEWDTGSPREYPDYTIIRAKFYMGRWVAEVVPFFANETTNKTYRVRYEPNCSLTSWSAYEETCFAGPYNIAGQKPDYCGMRHVGWSATIAGLNPEFHKTIDLSDDTTDDGVLELRAMYEDHVEEKSAPDKTGLHRCWYASSPTISSTLVVPASSIPDWKENHLTIGIKAWVCRFKNNDNARVYFTTEKNANDEWVWRNEYKVSTGSWTVDQIKDWGKGIYEVTATRSDPSKDFKVSYAVYGEVSEIKPYIARIKFTQSAS